MEATGVYYEIIAYLLAEKGFKSCVMLQNKRNNYTKTLPDKSKTDSIDSRILTRLGLERKLEE